MEVGRARCRGHDRERMYSVYLTKYPLQNALVADNRRLSAPLHATRLLTRGLDVWGGLCSSVHTFSGMRTVCEIRASHL